jgi:hypothetical protein
MPVYVNCCFYFVDFPFFSFPVSLSVSLSLSLSLSLCAYMSIVCISNLIQVWGPSPRGPHIDLWLWTPLPLGQESGPVASVSSKQFTTANPPHFWTGEDAHYNPRVFTDIAPLKTGSSSASTDAYKWLGIPVTLPNDPHSISQKEYGRYGGSYMEAQVFRGDCFHNFFNLRFAY